MRTTWLSTIGAALTFGLLLPPPAFAADHADGTGSALDQPDGSSDITDYFAWMTSDKANVNLVMDVYPNATTTSTFSNAVRYVFHTEAKMNFTIPAASTDPARNLVCSFSTVTAPATTQTISCWLIDVTGTNNTVLDYVSQALPATPTAIASTNGMFKVWAGLRDDPFYFNLAGFANATKAVTAAASALLAPSNVNAHGCPVVGGSTTTALVGALAHDCTGSAAPVDFFKPNSASANSACTDPYVQNSLAGSGNIMAIVVQVASTALGASSTAGQVSTWASTHKAM